MGGYTENAFSDQLTNGTMLIIWVHARTVVHLVLIMVVAGVVWE